MCKDFKFLIVLIIILGFNPVAFSQQINLPFNHLNHNNGLSETMNAYVFKDSYGFVWISSNDGLNRFDGKAIKQYRSTGEANALKGKIINSNFFEDAFGNIWFCSYDAINCYQRKTDDFKSYYLHVDGKASMNDYYGFYLDNQARFWITNANHLYLFNTQTKRYTNSGLLIANRCLVHKNTKSEFELYSFFYGQHVIQKYKLINSKLIKTHFFAKSKQELTFKNTYCITVDNDSVLWMGTNEGLVKINTQAETTTVYNKYENTVVSDVRGIAINSKYVFAASSNGLLIFDRKLNSFSKRIKSDPTNPYSLSVNNLNDLYLDYENILWVSIWNKGIDYTNINKSNYQLILNQNTTGIENSKIDYHAIANDSEGNYWFGTNRGLTVTDKNFNLIKVYTTSTTQNTISNNKINYLMHDPKASKIWVCSMGGGVDCYDEKTKQFYQVKPDSAVGTIINSSYILKLKNEKIICAIDSGLHEIIETKAAFNFCSTPFLKGVKGLTEFTTLYETSNGLLLAAYKNKYLAVFKITTTGLEHLSNLDVAATVIQFYEDPATKTVWVTTGNGLLKLNTTTLKFQFIKNIKGIDGEYLYSILPHDKYVWISSGQGIIRLNTQTLEARTYNANDGLAILDFWDYCSFKLPDNRLMIGGSGGINIFNPADIYRDTIESQLQLTALKINDQPYALPVSLSYLKDLKLNYNENTFSFEFADLHLGNIGHNHFQYRMDELDTGWVDNGANNFIRFAQLNHGDYNLKIRAANADGIWSKPFALAIHIKPPWYKTWWAYAIDVIFGIGLIVWITVSFTNEKLRKQRIIIEKQQAVEAERSRISAEMHDDLGASLSTMKLMCEVVKSKLETSDSTEEIDFISHTSNDLVYKMREIIWSMNSKYDSLDDLIGYTSKYVREYLAISNIKFEMEIPKVIPDCYLNGEARRNIFLVVKETLHNTFKHAHASNVQIAFNIYNKSAKSTELKITIHDNGVGINLDAIHRFGNGLDSMKKRLEQVGGTYDISKQNGTVTTLVVQLNKNSTT